MIISRGRRYVFVHIPKTGGTAMAGALEARAMADDILIGDTEKAQRRKGRLEGLPARGRVWKHSTLRDMDGVLSDADLAQMLVFTLVRNPWNRMVSYYHWLRAQDFDHPAVRAAQRCEFRRFLANAHVQESFRQSPAASYVARAPAPVFVRLEHLAQDLAPVEAHLGFALGLERVNVSDRPRDYRAAYDAPTREIVADICAEDIKQFGYCFE
jgi:hypothetical protein